VAVKALSVVLIVAGFTASHFVGSAHAEASLAQGNRAVLDSQVASANNSSTVALSGALFSNTAGQNKTNRLETRDVIGVAGAFCLVGGLLGTAILRRRYVRKQLGMPKMS